MQIYIDENSAPDLPKMGIEDTGSIEFDFKVISVSVGGEDVPFHDNDNKDGRRYSLEVTIKGIKVDKVSLEEATSRASSGITKIQFQPSP